MPQLLQTNKRNALGISRHIMKLPEEQEQQKLSYQTNKLAQYIQLQLSDLQNTLHYIQKKHSINQIKESISHSYNIFSETEPIFRQLRINFVYQKIKKLVNCFSIIYLILMQHIQKPSKYPYESDPSKNNDSQNEGSTHYQSTPVTRKNTLITEKKNTINHFSQITEFGAESNGVKKPKPLGGIHLYNQQYNRHIESDLDRLKRKLKQQAKQSQQSSNPKLSQKQKLKEQIFKQINTDIYGSPSPDQLTLFFNLNSNRYGSELQYITFQDELQQIAAFFKESQDEALQFLNKSRDDFIFMNFNQGFKEMISQYKIQKEQQVNGYFGKVKNLFESIKHKTVQKQNQINQQIVELKRLQQKINKPNTSQLETQTSYNFDEQISRLKKRIQELDSNYNALRDYHKNQNENQQKSITFLQHKIAFKDHQISILKKQLEQKSHFINFLNDKINNGTDPKVLRKISNLYRNHSKKNSSKLKIQLEQLQKQGSIDLKTFKNKTALKQNQNEQGQKADKLKSKQLEQGQQPENQLQRNEKKSLSSPFQDFDKPNKRKRKPGISFFATPDKRLGSYVERNASFNLQNIKIQEVNSQMEKATSGDSGDIPLYQEHFQQNKLNEDKVGSLAKKDKQRKNLVNHEKRKTKDRNSLQVVQKTNSKNFEPKRSAFASGFVNGKFTLTENKSQNTLKRESFKENMSEKSGQNLLQEQELMNEINNMANLDDSFVNQEQEENNSEFQENDSYLNQSDVRSNNQYISESSQIEDSQERKFPSDKSRKASTIKKQERRSNKIQNKNLESPGDSKKGLQQRILTDSNSQKLKRSIQTIKSNEFENKNEQGLSKGKLSSQKTSNQLIQIKQKQTSRKTFNSFENKNKNQVANQLKQSQNTQLARILQRKSKNKFKTTSLRDQDQNNQQNSLQESFTDKNSDNQNTFLNAINELNSMEGLKPKQKQKIISTYFTSLYKEQKIKCSTLISKMVQISISNEMPQQNLTELSKKNNNQATIQISNDNFTADTNKVFTATNGYLSSKAQDVTSIANKSKNSSGNISDFKNNRVKLSQANITDSLQKQRQNKIISQNYIQNLTTFKDITATEELKQQENSSQRQESSNKIDQNNKRAVIQRKSSTPDYERIYGIVSASCNRNQKKNSFSSNALNQQDKLKMEDYLEKAAIKVAIRSKNIEEFKAKIKKMHQPKCGQSCKHLERYLQNFNKYRSSNRQIMKIHIQNVNHTIPHNNQPFQRSVKQNSVTFPSINTLNSTGFSSKGFSSVQKSLNSTIKK